MKIILYGMFILIFSMVNFAQPSLNQPFEMKKGETVEISGLKIKFLGSTNEWATGWGSDGKRLEITYLRYQFEVTQNGNAETKAITNKENFGDYVLIISSSNRVVDKNKNEVCQILILNTKQFDERKEQIFANQADYEKLLQTKIFALGGVGYAGIISEGETLTRKFLPQKGAMVTFMSLLENGTPEAKLYAIWGLRKLNGRASKASFDEYRNLSTMVNRMSGCERFSEKFSESVKEIENPFYLKMTAKQLWAMDLEQRKAMLTNEEEEFLLAIFRIYKSSGELDKIANVPFGKLFQKEANNILGK
jgi:hypothetical protein